MTSLIYRGLKALISCSFALALVSLAGEASANLIFDLNTDGCSSGCGATSYGTVTLSTVDADTVHVDVELTPQFVSMFIQTGAGYSFTWKGPSGETVSGLTTGFN